jgi:hypothetical protein
LHQSREFDKEYDGAVMERKARRKEIVYLRTAYTSEKTLVRGEEEAGRLALESEQFIMGLSEAESP